MISIRLIESILFRSLGCTGSVESVDILGTGDTAKSFKIKSSAGLFFIKLVPGESELLTAEKYGTEKLKKLKLFSFPKIIATGKSNGYSYLLAEYISSGTTNSAFWQKFGRTLAQQHRHTSDDGLFGLEKPNFIGSLNQNNDWKKEWTTFFIENRLEPQIQLAINDHLIEGKTLARFQSLYDVLSEVLVPEPPSLLHGDLWRGNFLVDPKGEPFLIDPAIYFGNREIEISFTLLFGGFHQDFYTSYNEMWPLEKDFSLRSEIYNLYPLLVHLNLFGKSYLPPINRVLEKFS